MQDFLMQLLNTPSTTSDIVGVTKIQTLISNELKKLGFSIELSFAESSSALGDQTGPFLVAEKKSNHKNDSLVVSFVTHADTVDGFEHSVFVDNSCKLAVGQGVLDDKASQVVALWGIKKFLAKVSDPRISLRFISSPNEEKGSVGFHSFYKKLSQDSAVVLGFEPATESGEIIVSRRGNRWYRVVLEGVESHAGRAPFDGINSAYDVARALVELEKLNSRSSGVTLVPGSIKSIREAYNVVCGGLELRLDLRFSTFEARDAADGFIRNVFSTLSPGLSSPGGVSKVSIEIVDDCPPVARTQGAVDLAKIYQESLEVGTANAIDSGGSADVCYMSRPGLLILDGLGAIGAKMHSTEEWVDLESVEHRSTALSNFLIKINQKQSL